MKNLTLQNLIYDLESFSIGENDSYINSYREFINYFKQIEEIKIHHLIIASHFVYGWMPTILKLNTTEKNILPILNAAKSGKILSCSELNVVIRCINNSLVGTSKLLHFINPEIYAILDSKVYRYLTGNKYSYGINRPESYLKYLTALNEITNHIDYNKLHVQVEKKLNYEVSPMRAIEFIMFKTNLNNKQ